MTARIKSSAVLIALVAMLLRALLPDGWMPSASTPGLLTICTMDGLLTVDAQGVPHKAPSKDTLPHHDLCPFGASAHHATPVAAVVVPQPRAFVRGDGAHFASAQPRLRKARQPQSLRGPPAFA